MAGDISAASKAGDYSNGTANDGAEVSNEFDALYSQDSTIITALNRIKGLQSAARDAKLEGINLLLREDFTGTPDAADDAGLFVERGASSNVGIRWNEGTDLWELTTDGSNYYQIITFAELGSSEAPAVPQYATAATITMASFNVLNQGGDGYITATTTKTADLSSFDAVGGNAQSANLTGTVSVSSGAASVTGSGTAFSTDFIVGDVIYTAGGQGRRITVISSNTSMTVESNWSSTESGVTFKRGGEAPNTWYHLYAIGGSTPGLLFSTRNVAAGNTLDDLPSGYTDYHQFAYSVRNDSSGNIIPQRVVSGWPNTPTIIYTVSTSYFNGSSTVNGTCVVLTGGTSGTFATLSLGSYVPATSRAVLLHGLGATGPFVGAVRETSTSIVQALSPAAGGGNLYTPAIGCSATQQIDYVKYGGAGSLYLDVYGYVVTEV